MAYNKVIYKGEVIMDITDSTVTPETLDEGIIAYGANGERIVGIDKDESGLPIKVDTLDETLLIADNNEKLYESNGRLYQVEKITSLKGLTIKFNKHLTGPCPVIDENDEFECSGTAMMQDFTNYLNPYIVTMRKKLYNDPSLTSDIVFTIRDTDPDDEDTYITYDLFIGEDWNGNLGWVLYDENGNVIPAVVPAVISNFDCPELNENPALIEWVLANAKVYSKIESTKDIKSFKLNRPLTYLHKFHEGLAYSIFNINRTAAIVEFDIEGRYTATFLANGELITETFTHIKVNGRGDYSLIFSNDNSTLILVPDPLDDGSGLFNLNYNDVTLDSDITFTEFDCAFNKEWHLLSFILSCTDVGEEYHNGHIFKELTFNKKYHKTVEVM